MKRIYEYLRIGSRCSPFLKRSGESALPAGASAQAGSRGVLLVIFFVLLPFTASAQVPTHYPRYCPDPAQIFTGVAYDESGKPEIELLVESS